ncbi:MAG: hypothetical protein Q9171_000676 [Xanthocarpia ochracea]
MALLAVRLKGRRSYSLDSGLNLFQQAHSTSSHLVSQQPISADGIWDSYFDGDGFVYQGLDLDLIQNRVIESEAHSSSDHSHCTLPEQQHLDHTVGEGPEATGEGSVIKKRQMREIPTSDVFLEYPNFSPDNEFADMTKRSNINHDRVLSGDTCCQSLSGFSPSEPLSREFQTSDREEEDNIGFDSHEASKRLEPPTDNHPQKALLDTLRQETDDLLRTPLTPMPLETGSEHGFPLGVAVAKNAYDQGLLSTEAFHRDCLPSALTVLKSPLLPGRITDTHNLSIGIDEYQGDRLPLPHGRKKPENDSPKPVVKRRNLSYDAQLKRIGQAPLSAIYEEPAGSQHACACGLCSDSGNGRSIVWFHLCPRYAAIARENGITYEPCEARVIMHHGPDRSSVGLIIEGPMEDRFVPAIAPPQLPEAPDLDKIKSPKPGKLDLRAMHSATGLAARNLTRSTRGPKVHQLPPISTPALQRPISPAMLVSHPTSLSPLYYGYCPTQGQNSSIRDTPQTCQGDLEQPPAIPCADPQENVHPALRNRLVLPQDWARPPSRKQSHASIQDRFLESSQTPNFDVLRRSSTCSDFSGELPTRTDSLGASSHRGPFKKQDKSNIDHHSKTEEPLTNIHTRHSTSSTCSGSLLSPFASHERTPSVFLGPSTPSTASYQRSSVSSYGDPLPSYTFPSEENARAADAKETKLASPFLSHQHSINHDADEGPFSPQSSYHTAPDSHYAESPPLATPQTVPTSLSSLGRLRSRNPSQNSPFFETHGYLRSQTSQRSLVQTSDSLPNQGGNSITSGTNLLNGHAFDDVDSRSQPDGLHVMAENADYDYLGMIDDAQDGRSDHSAIPLDAVGAAETHCTNFVPSGKISDKEAAVNAGLGISSSSAIFQQPSQISRPTPPSHTSNATKELPECYVSNRINPTHERTEPLRRSLVIQHNLCSHNKLHHMLGIDPEISGRHKSPRHNTQSPSMTADEVPPIRKGIDRLGFVKKGSSLFREKKNNLADKVKASWKVKPEDWQDNDDRN